MCILLKLDYATFGVSDLFFSNVIEEKPLGGSARPPLVKEGLIESRIRNVVEHPIPFTLQRIHES